MVAEEYTNYDPSGEEYYDYESENVFSDSDSESYYTTSDEDYETEDEGSDDDGVVCIVDLVPDISSDEEKVYEEDFSEVEWTSAEYVPSDGEIPGMATDGMDTDEEMGNANEAARELEKLNDYELEVIEIIDLMSEDDNEVEIIDLSYVASSEEEKEINENEDGEEEEQDEAAEEIHWTNKNGNILDSESELAYGCKAEMVLDRPDCALVMDKVGCNPSQECDNRVGRELYLTGKNDEAYNSVSSKHIHFTVLGVTN